VLTLIRWKVSAAVTFSAFTAMVLYTGRISALQVLPLAGIFLLASGASALNQWQERTTDARMERTKSRPLASGRMQPTRAMTILLLILFTGGSMLLVFSPFSCFILGLLNVLWYNGLYTTLKRKTAFAVVPGALTGAIPVYMGWTAMGGLLTDPSPAILAFFIFIWQMPHFWLLMLEYEEDYRNAGLPSITSVFRTAQVKSVITSWMIASSASSFLLIRFELIRSSPAAILLVFLNAGILLLFLFRFYRPGQKGYRILFAGINIFMLIVLVLILSCALTVPR
jgi:protoheme IX farnesyltransferase